jgi:hypothetical protein
VHAIQGVAQQLRVGIGIDSDMERWDGAIRDCVTCRETTPRFVLACGAGDLDERSCREGKRGRGGKVGVELG